MTDEEFKLAIARKLLDLEAKIDAQREVLSALNDQQSELNNLLLDWCETMEEELGEDDHWGLFRGDGDADDDDAA